MERKQVVPPAGPNIRFHGPFDGFSSLPLQQFDAFLYTSQWDGLPNILLEAGASGLPIIASDVGGVAELIHHGETGFLASPYDDPEPYRSALLSLLTGRNDLEQLNRRMSCLLAERHSWEAFVAALRTIPGYVASERDKMTPPSPADDCGRWPPDRPNQGSLSKPRIVSKQERRNGRMNTVIKALRRTVSYGQKMLVPRDRSRPSRLRLWVGGERSHEADAAGGAGGRPYRAPVRLCGQLHRASRTDVNQGIGDRDQFPHWTDHRDRHPRWLDHHTDGVGGPGTAEDHHR